MIKDPPLNERQRRILAAGMISVQGRVQREGDVVHVVAQHLASVGERDSSFPLLQGCGHEFQHGSPGIDPRSLPRRGRTEGNLLPDLHIDSIKVKTRDFR